MAKSVDKIVKGLHKLVTQLEDCGLICTEDMVKRVDSVAAVAEETAAGTEEASSATEEQTASMEQLTTSAQELAGIAEKLQEAVTGFKVEK